ncbi:MAG: glycosyltransferase family 9 protein [Dehalococcoidia bacterium]|nr:glycosyltransferase family 9 protein [Dehalococcoidia bacterium]
MTEAARWQEAQRILAVRLDGGGDVLMTTPALRALRESVSGRHLTLLASPAGAAVARLVPEVDEVMEYAAPWMKPASASDTTVHLGMVEALRVGRFDAAVIFTVYSQTPYPAALLCTLAGIPLRLAHAREKPYGLLSDWAPEPEPERFIRHEARRQLDLVATAGATTPDERLSLRVPAEAAERVGEMLTRIERGRPWCVLHPGASAPSRRYPVESFRRVVDLLAREHGWQVVLAGGPSEVAMTAWIAAGGAPGVLDVSGRLGLPELAALIEAAPMLICNNSLPAHIAAATGTPVVDLYALTNPQHTPWSVPHRVLFHDVPCRNCEASVCPQGHHDCLRQVRPEQVVAAALELVQGTQPSHVNAPLALPVVRGPA